MNIRLERIDMCGHWAAAACLKVWQTSFPWHEQMSAAFWVETLQGIAQHPELHWSAVVDAGKPDEPIGMAFWEVCEITDQSSSRVSYLWYLCIEASLRGRGQGTEAFKHLREAMEQAGCDLLVFEVEIPEEAGPAGSEQRLNAERRISWYRRQGASQLRGVRWVQSVDNGSEPTPMHLMVLPLRGTQTDATSAYAAACSALAQDIEIIGALSLG